VLVTELGDPLEHQVRCGLLGGKSSEPLIEAAQEGELALGSQPQVARAEHDAQTTPDARCDTRPACDAGPRNVVERKAFSHRVTEGNAVVARDTVFKEEHVTDSR